MAIRDIFEKDFQELEAEGILFSTIKGLVAWAVVIAFGQQHSDWLVAPLR